MSKSIWLKITLVVVIVASYYGYQIISPKPIQSPTASPSVNSSDENVVVSSDITLEQIAEHNNKDSCWMAIEGSVYDMTPFVASGFHPGGEAILAGCGIDATELFNNRPMGSKTPHSSTAKRMMEKYKIGSLGN